MSRNPNLKGIPAAVAGNPENRTGIILAANYEARNYNVKTAMTVSTAKRLCPDITFVTPDKKFYKEKSKAVMNLLSRYSPLIQKNSIDEAWMDLTGCEDLFGKPITIANKIMKDIIYELGLNCSIGISYCKFLSKMASEMKKPLGITEIWENDIKEKLWPLKLNYMYGIGKKTENKLNRLRIFTIGDLAKFNKNLLIKNLGKHGLEIHNLANGIDDSPVLENPESEYKSIGRSTTLPKDITDIEKAKNIILELSEEVGKEARFSNYKGKTVSIVIKYFDFTSITRQKSVEPTYLTKNIYTTGCYLLEKNWNEKRPVRLLGITLSNINLNQMEQISLFDLEKISNKNPNLNNSKEEILEKTLDNLKDKFGNNILKRATLIENKKIKE
jgi:DNA polymerase-4